MKPRRLKRRRGSSTRRKAVGTRQESNQNQETRLKLQTSTLNHRARQESSPSSPRYSTCSNNSLWNQVAFLSRLLPSIFRPRASANSGLYTCIILSSLSLLSWSLPAPGWLPTCQSMIFDADCGGRLGGCVIWGTYTPLYCDLGPKETHAKHLVTPHWSH